MNEKIDKGHLRKKRKMNNLCLRRLNIIIVTSILLLFFTTIRGQESSSFKSYQSIAIGFDGYWGYEKIGDAFSFKSDNTKLLMKNAFIPFMGIIHHFNPKGFATLKVGYGFMKSSDYEIVIDSIMYIYDRRLRDVKIDIEVNYWLINTHFFAILVSGEVGVNIITEKIENYENDKYSQFGYGIGAGIGIKKGIFTGLIVKFDYYRIGKNILIGTGFEIPIFSNNNIK